MLSRFIAAQIMAAGLTLADAAAQLGVPEDKLAAGELDDAQQDALSALLANGIAAKAAAPAMEEAQAAKSALAAAKTVGSVAERTSLELTQRIDALEKRTKTLQERHVTSLKLAAVRDGCITPAEVDTDGAFGYLLGQVADQDYETGLRPLLASTRAYKPGTISTGPARPIGSLPGERGTEQMDRIEAGRRLGEHLVADAALERPVYNRSLSALVANPPPNLIEAARIYAGQES